MSKLLTTAALLATFGAGAASADLFINEVLGSTGGSDLEFIEIYNSGPSAVDLTGYSIELWDSDVGGSFGTLDGGAPYVLSGSVAPGGYYLLANSLAVSEYNSSQSVDFSGSLLTSYNVVADESLPSNAIENSSYTIILADAASNAVDSIFVTDGDAGDAANRGGSPFVVGASVGPDGSFLPAGVFRTTDGGSSFGILHFSTPSFDLSDKSTNLGNGTPEGGTPGFTNIVPEPASLALLAAGLGVAGLRRRK